MKELIFKNLDISHYDTFEHNNMAATVIQFCAAGNATELERVDFTGVNLSEAAFTAGKSGNLNAILIVIQQAISQENQEELVQHAIAGADEAGHVNLAVDLRNIKYNDYEEETTPSDPSQVVAPQPPAVTDVPPVQITATPIVNNLLAPVTSAVVLPTIPIQPKAIPALLTPVPLAAQLPPVVPVPGSFGFLAPPKIPTQVKVVDMPTIKPFSIPPPAPVAQIKIEQKTTTQVANINTNQTIVGFLAPVADVTPPSTQTVVSGLPSLIPPTGAKTTKRKTKKEKEAELVQNVVVVAPTTKFAVSDQEELYTTPHAHLDLYQKVHLPGVWERMFTRALIEKKPDIFNQISARTMGMKGPHPLQSELGNQCLYLAAENNLSQCFDFIPYPNMNYGLEGAAAGGHTHLIEYFLQQKANGLNSALGLACEKERQGAVKMLIAKGATMCTHCNKHVSAH